MRRVAMLAAALAFGAGGVVYAGVATADEVPTYRLILTGTVAVDEFDWIGGGGPVCNYQLSGYTDLVADAPAVHERFSWHAPDKCGGEVETKLFVYATLRPGPVVDVVVTAYTRTDECDGVWPVSKCDSGRGVYEIDPGSWTDRAGNPVPAVNGPYPDGSEYKAAQVGPAVLVSTTSSYSDQNFQSAVWRPTLMLVDTNTL